MSSIRTQGKISTAHRRLGTANGSRSLSQLAQETEPPAPSLYDLVTAINSNMEVLMKRSQNNARDLGRLRGDVKNPQVVEELKKLLQESTAAQNLGEMQDPERRKQLDSELSAKLDVILKASTTTGDKSTAAAPVSTTDPAILTQAAVAATAAEAAASTGSQVLALVSLMQSFLEKHLPVVIPAPEPMVVEPQRSEPVPVSIDTTALEAIVSDLSLEINNKVQELRALEDTLEHRRSELANLESRTTHLQSTLVHLVDQVTNANMAEKERMRISMERREERREQRELRTKKSTIGRRALMPLAPSMDRRIVSLSNVPSSPSRKQPASPAAKSILAAPLRHESPFARAVDPPVAVPNNAPVNAQPSPSPHRPMQTTMRTPPARKASWSRRVSQIFLSSGNKENGQLRSVYEDKMPANGPKQAIYADEKWSESTLGRGFKNSRDLRGSVRSFRSFSHR